MGAAVLQVLEAIAASGTLGECVREHNFAEIYKVLGDERAMETIRQTAPRAPHCAFLKQNSRACIYWPDELYEVGGPKIGAPCPNNPYLKPENKKTIEQADADPFLVETIVTLSEMARLHLLNYDTITPVELAILGAVETFRRQSEAKAHQRITEQKNAAAQGQQ